MSEYIPLLEEAAVTAMTEGQELVATRILAARGDLEITGVFEKKHHISLSDVLLDSTKRLVEIIDGEAQTIDTPHEDRFSGQVLQPLYTNERQLDVSKVPETL